jgi:hypothetical protein
MNSVAGHVNAAQRNALTSQRLALKQQQINIAAHLANAQLLKWQAERDHASGIDWLEGEIENMRRIAAHDPVATAVRSRAVLATTPHPESMHQLEHKRALRKARSDLESFWGSLAPAARGDAHAFAALGAEPPNLRARAEGARLGAASAEQDHADATVRAQRAPIWIGGSGFAVMVSIVGVAAIPGDGAGACVFLFLLAFAATILTVIRWPLLVLAARKTAKLLEQARYHAEATHRAEVAFWSDPTRGLLLGAAVRRSPGLREQAWWYTGQDAVGNALPEAGARYR